MGISCVAIYTQDDANSPYVKEADEAYKLKQLFGCKRNNFYCKNSGSHAIHPDMAFYLKMLGLNSVKKAGIIWIGPSGMSLKKWEIKLPLRN